MKSDAELAASDPKVRQAKPDDFVDMRFVEEFERYGFFKTFGGKIDEYEIRLYKQFNLIPRMDDIA